MKKASNDMNRFFTLISGEMDDYIESYNKIRELIEDENIEKAKAYYEVFQNRKTALLKSIDIILDIKGYYIERDLGLLQDI